MHTRYDLTVTLTGVEACPALPEALGVLLFQCVQELLFNVVKHARVESVSVTLQTFADSLRLEVADEGQGFVLPLPEAGATLPSASLATGFGLYSVEQRLKVFGGVMHIASSPATGTQVIIEVPLA
jgi:signal transduction histidine kinase